MKYLFLLFFFLSPFVYAFETQPKHTINIGILSFRDIDENQKAWKPLEEYLNKQNQTYQYKIHSYAQNDLEKAVAKNELDIVIAHSLSLVTMETKYHTHNIASIVKKDLCGHLLTTYGSVIVVKSNREDINNLQDIKNKKIAVSHKEGFASYLVPYDLLKENGIDMEKDSKVLFTGQPMDKVWDALDGGKADVGVFRTGYLEELIAKGKLKLSDIKVINSQKVEGFHYMLSSKLYPEWAVAAAKNASGEEVKMITLALYSIKKSNCTEYDSFTVPSSYVATRELMEKYHIYPFDYEEATLELFYEKYELVIEFSILLLLFWSWAFTYYYIRSSRKMKQDANQLQTILTTASDGIHVHDKDGKFIFFSDSFHNMLGYTREEMEHLSVFDLEKNLNSEQIANVINDVITNNKILRFEAKHQKKDGRFIAIELIINAITLDNKPYIYAVSRDITQQKALENQLLKAQEIGHFGSYEFDIKNNLWTSSKELNNILGIDENYQKTAQSWLDIIHKDFIDEMRQYLYTNILTNKENFDKVYKIKNQVTKEDRWVYGKGTLELDIDNNPLKLFGVIQDITLQKEYELLIIEKKEEFETIFETSQAGIAVMDLDSNFLKVNEAYSEITGLSKEELLQTSCIRLSIPEDVEKSKQIFKDVAKYGRVDDFEKHCIINGKKLTVSMSLSLMPDNQHILASIKNISYKKLFEEQSKLAIMGEMIGNITHQWRQPLSVISTIASGISFRSEMGTLEDYNNTTNDMEMIMVQINYLSHTIEDFRNFIRGDTLAQEVSAKRMIDKTTSIIGATMKKNDISLILNCEDDFIFMGFENELIQAIINIINNAKDALLENLGSEEEKYIFINISNKDEKYIEFLDNGGGILEDVLPRIFEPYFTTKALDVGTGIGLSMTYKIITEHHNASIEASNKEYEYNKKKHKGASFRIIFDNPKLN